MSVLQACEQLGIEIPRFCFHDRLSVPANCRMCLVDIERSPKPVASCAMPVAEGMVVHTNNEAVHRARRSVMEFLLINHPLDCPICDQGGECDLQDLAMGYGFDRSRYHHPKRAVAEKELGPLIRTHMTRCIHCTRCVRFADEIAGMPELGATGRGEHMEIGTYVAKAITSELSGNMIDICPVGALTSKPYAFTARPWELKRVESIDVLDAVGSHIKVDARSRQVMRVTPRLCEDINEEWISDRTRFAYDGLMHNRLDQPYLRDEAGHWQAVGWDRALAVLAARLKATTGTRIAALAGDLCPMESQFALRSLLDELGCGHRDCRQDGAALPPGIPAGYRFNTTIAGLEQADAVLLVGTNPRWEATIINARLRKQWLHRRLPIASIGPVLDLTYDVQSLGASPQVLTDPDLGGFAQTLKNARNPVIIVGQGALTRPDGAAILGAARDLADRFKMMRKDWQGFNVLHTAAARVGGMQAGFVPTAGGLDRNGILAATREGEIDVLWLLGADELPLTDKRDAFVVYQGHHGDRGARLADLILPASAPSEESGTYTNTEGRIQHAAAVVTPPGQAKPAWRVIRALSEQLGKVLPFDTVQALREASPIFELGAPPSASWQNFGRAFGEKAGPIDPAPLTLPIEDYYRVCPLTRSSPTMAACAKEIAPAALSAGVREEVA